MTNDVLHIWHSADFPAALSGARIRQPHAGQVTGMGISHLDREEGTHHERGLSVSLYSFDYYRI